MAWKPPVDEDPDDELVDFVSDYRYSTEQQRYVITNGGRSEVFMH